MSFNMAHAIGGDRARPCTNVGQRLAQMWDTKHFGVAKNPPYTFNINYTVYCKLLSSHFLSMPLADAGTNGNPHCNCHNRHPLSAILCLSS